MSVFGVATVAVKKTTTCVDRVGGNYTRIFNKNTQMKIAFNSIPETLMGGFPRIVCDAFELVSRAT